MQGGIIYQVFLLILGYLFCSAVILLYIELAAVSISVELKYFLLKSNLKHCSNSFEIVSLLNM